MTAVLQGEGLTRAFGALTAVDDVDLAVVTGEVVGLLGANGAGKTTLIRMLLGLLAPDAGRVRMLGGAPTRQRRAGVGYVPQHLGLYADLSVRANRRFQHTAFGVDGGGVGAGAPEGLDDDTLVAELPLGARRRLAFRFALDHDPRLLVLDEPTSGVGPLGRARLWEEIGAAAGEGRGVLVTTHYLAEAEQCDRLVVLARGRVVAAGTVDEIVGEATAVVVGGVPVGPTLTALQTTGMVATLAAGGVAVPGDDEDGVRDVLARAGLDREATVTQRPATLEERFVQLAGAPSDEAAAA